MGDLSVILKSINRNQIKEVDSTAHFIINLLKQNIFDENLGITWQRKVKRTFKEFFRLCESEKKMLSAKLIEKVIDFFYLEFDSLSFRLLKIDWNFFLHIIKICLKNALFVRECNFTIYFQFSLKYSTSYKSKNYNQGFKNNYKSHKAEDAN